MPRMEELSKPSGGRKRRPSALKNALARWFFLGWLAFTIFTGAHTIVELLVNGAILSFGSLAVLLVETYFERPIRSYLRLALLSAFLFAILVISVGRSGGSIALGAITWFGLTCIGLFWTVHYERTEGSA